MRIKLLQYYTPNYKLGPISEQINRDYCNIFNIEYYCEKNESVINSVIESEGAGLPGFPGGRAKQWYKIHQIKNELLTKKFDYIVFIDSDAAIVNKKVDIRRFINRHADKDLIIGSDMNFRDYRNDRINTGVMIFKNTEWSINFLERVWRTGNDIARGLFRWDIWHEQTIISILLYINSSDFEKAAIIRHDADLSLNDPNLREGKTFIFHDIDKNKLQSLI